MVNNKTKKKGENFMEYLLNNVLAERPNKTVYYEEGKTIKLFNDSYPASQILNEALSQTRVSEETNLRIPKLIEVTKLMGRWAIVSEFIEGKTLECMMNENPEKIDEYMDLFVNIQMQILSNRVPLLGRIKEKFRRKLTETELIDNDIKYELLQRLEGMKNHFKLCHGDFNPSNVIIGQNGDWYVIDWAHATQGNASADAARTFLLFSMQGRKELAEKYLKVFEEKSTITKHEVQRWIPIVAATQLTKGKEEEKAFLSEWINVVEYQ